jgi:hypothetical protein
MHVEKIIVECITDADSVDDVVHALLRLLCSEEREDITVLGEKAPRFLQNYRDHDADAHGLGVLRFEAARPVVGSGANRRASVAAGSGSERSKD